MITRWAIVLMFFALHIFSIKSCADRQDARRAYVAEYKRQMACEHVGYKGRGEEKLYKCGVTGILKTESEM